MGDAECGSPTTPLRRSEISTLLSTSGETTGETTTAVLSFLVRRASLLLFSCFTLVPVKARAAEKEGGQLGAQVSAHLRVPAGVRAARSS
jgi:hypothetical protein